MQIRVAVQQTQVDIDNKQTVRYNLDAIDIDADIDSDFNLEITYCVLE